MSPASGGVSEGLDTALARLLDHSGCVSREELVRALQEVRAGRSENPNLSLGAQLLSRGSVSPEDLDRALAQLSPPPAQLSNAPQQIGPYRVLEVLGVGGMGKVFAVEHIETLRREALKTVEVALDPDEAERFRREAEVLASLDHPGLIRIYGGEFESGRPYLTLELCEGGSLQSRLRHGPLPPAEVLALARALGSALDYLHGRGVLHRDLKPDNVLFDGQGRPKLTDFGLARVRGAQGLTATGEILGTPAYMAPEQAGRAHEADARSDVYGFAATLYAAATGRPPFVGAGLFNVLAQVLERPPASPTSLGLSLPAELEAGIMRGLAKVPDQRPPSAGALVASLQDPSALPARPQAKGRVVAMGVLALAACAALGSPALLRSRDAPSPSPPPVSETPRVSQPAALEALPPRELWVALAQGKGPLSPPVIAQAWSAILIVPPDKALERALRRRGPSARELVAYARLKGGRKPGPEVVRWEDLDTRRAEFAQRYLTSEALPALGDPLALVPVKARLQALTKSYLELIQRQPLPRPLMDYYVGRYQQTYLQGRRALKPIQYGPAHAVELAALLDATGGDLADVEARLAYYLQAFNQDVLTVGNDKIPLDVELSPDAGIFAHFALALFQIVHHPSEVVAERQAKWVTVAAKQTGYTTQDLPARALLTLQQRLWRQSIREGRPKLLRIARWAQEYAATGWKDQLKLRRLRNSVVQLLAEGKPGLARQALVPYDLERAEEKRLRYGSFDQSRQLFEAQILLVEGDPASALVLIEGAHVGDERRLIESWALEAHALKLLSKPYRGCLRAFEKSVDHGWVVPAGLEWYLHDARGIIEGRAWWPADGPPKPR